MYQDSNHRKHLTWDDAERLYQAALDCEPLVIIAGASYLPSRALQEIDPIAYRCGLLDYVDALERDGYTIEDA